MKKNFTPRALSFFKLQRLGVINGSFGPFDFLQPACYFDQNYSRPKWRYIKMKTMSLSEAKMKLSRLVEIVRDTDEEVMITKNGRPAAIIVSPDEFDSWRETIAIRSDAELMKEVKEGLSALKKKRAKLYTLEELFSV
jgi:antitoxin YefM